MAFAAHVQDDVLTLTLDTPGSSVNIFSHDASLELGAALAKVEPGRTRAVVIRSGKPMSFINGVGLMLANAVHTPEDAVNLTQATRDAYRAVRDCPVPTIAAIQGNCYGCGVEFVLNCDYRIAEETFDTHFYMTEIHDYLFIPAFGGTQNLPGLLGMKKAIDLVIWGEKWSASEAKRYGLVDKSVSRDAFESELRKLVDSGLKKRSPRHTRKLDAATVREAEKRIKALPPQYQKVYRDCLDLMVHAFKKNAITDADYDRELQKSARSVMVDASKHALSFFFIRQTAQGISLRALDSSTDAFAVGFEDGDRELLPLRKDLESRPVANARLARHAEARETEIRFFSREHSDDVDTGGVRAVADLAVERLAGFAGTDVITYFPGLRKGLRFAEVMAPASEAPAAAKVARYLGLVGFTPIVTRPGSDFVTNRLLGAFYGALLSELWDGATPASLAKTLRSMGFIRTPGETLAQLSGGPHVASFVTPHLPERHTEASSVKIVRDLKKLASGDYRRGAILPSALDSVCLTMLAAVRAMFADGSVTHPALVDLCAREVLDFPLAHKSLCAYLTRERVERMIGRAVRRRRAGVSDEAIASARAYLEQRRGFYL